MPKLSSSILNRLLRKLPEGLIVDAAWLEENGVSSSLRAYYVKSGWLEQPVRGVYRRSRGPLGWEQVVISLQTLICEKPLVVGGRTALELEGFEHYVAPEVTTVHLYGPESPPNWLQRLELPQRFVFHNSRRLFKDEGAKVHSGGIDTEESESRTDAGRGIRDASLKTLAWGQWDWPLTISRPERAILELLDELPDRESFHRADMIMQGAATLSPMRLQVLLEACSSVKVKRLFFYFADRHRHAWSRHLDKGAVDLGSGKRMLVRGGKLDTEYLITVPAELDDAS